MTSPSQPPTGPLAHTGKGTGIATPPSDPASMPDEDPSIGLPMTMSASVILTHLPRDASEALGEVEGLDRGKGE
jgi:ubiquitin-like protein ATG12